MSFHWAIKMRHRLYFLTSPWSLLLLLYTQKSETRVANFLADVGLNSH